ncbi:MAG: PAS domain S-box-containing protein [Haloarculaceae archaeon]|jgi:PAS domain S-box-containing protein
MTDGEHTARAEQLQALHEATRDLMTAETCEAVADIAVNAASDILGLDANAIYLYDEDDDVLDSAAYTDDLQDVLGDIPNFSEETSIAWRVFESGEATVIDDVRTDPDVFNPDTPMRSELYLPLGDRGLLIAGSPTVNSFGESDLSVGQVLAANIETALEQIERRQELQRYEDLVENVPVGICRLSPDGEQIVDVNPAMVTMFDADTRDELLARPVSDLFVDPSHQTEFEGACQDGQVVERELRFSSLADRDFWGSVTAFPFETNAEQYIVGIVEDITARKEYEQRLEDQRDTLEVLNQMVRHDIRNDLQLVLTYIELLEDHVDQEGQTYVETAIEKVNRAVDLTKTTREVTEVLLQTESDREPVALERVLRQQLDEIRSDYPDAVVTVDGTMEDVTVLASDILDSAVYNLLINAIQHNDKETPEVTVSVTTDDDEVTVSVADNGPGVPDDRKEEIFDKGERGTDSEGTGIGLYLVQALVESYGGEVWVEDAAQADSPGSDSPAGDSAGAVFRFTLQRADDK